MKKLIGLLLALLFFTSYVMADDIRFVQVTDLKYSKSDENNVLPKIINDINKLKNIDFVVFTGDNIQKPNEKDLKAFIKETKKLKKEFHIAIGEKDVNKHKDLSKKQYAKIARRNISIAKDGNINYIFTKKGVVFIIADGAKDVIPSANGYFKNDTVDWINTNLDSHLNQNVIIIQHFPLIPPENNETYVTLKPEKYMEVLNSHKNVKAIISGHFGVNKEEIKDGISHITTAPAPYYRIIDILDCTSSNPTIWAEVRKAE